MTFAGSAELTEAVAARSRRQHRAREIEHGLSNAHDLRMRRAHDHPIPRRQMTRRRRAPLALDPDEAGAAGAERTAVGVLAELGQRDAQRVDRIQHGRAGRHLDRALIDRELHGERILMDTASSAPTRLPARSRIVPTTSFAPDLMLLASSLLIFLAGPGRAAVDALWLEEEDDRSRDQIIERAQRQSGAGAAAVITWLVSTQVEAP